MVLALYIFCKAWKSLFSFALIHVVTVFCARSGMEEGVLKKTNRHIAMMPASEIGSIFFKIISMMGGL